MNESAKNLAHRCDPSFLNVLLLTGSYPPTSADRFEMHRHVLHDRLHKQPRARLAACHLARVVLWEASLKV